MRFSASQHQTKAQPFVHALLQAGHEPVAIGSDAFLIDLDLPQYQASINQQIAAGAKVFLYPHGGGVPQWIYDGMFAHDPRVTAHFVAGEGQREVLRRLGVDVPAYAVGFPYCDLLPFRPSDPPRHVLFAPNHPLDHDGSMPEANRVQNKEIFAALLELDIELTVRHVGAREHNGLWETPGAEFVEARLEHATEQIDRCDAVVAAGTFASLAIARGVPTIMWNERIVPSHRRYDGVYVMPENWDLYSDYIRYPYDIADGPLDELLADAGRSDEKVRDWRELFIGGQFDPAGFARLLDELRRDALVPGEARERVVIAFADEVAGRPELLAEFARRFGPEAPVTLLLYAPDADVDGLVPQLERAISAAGLDDATSPDILVLPLPRHEVHERALAARACALLGDRDVDGPLATLSRTLPDIPESALVA